MDSFTYLCFTNQLKLITMGDLLVILIAILLTALCFVVAMSMVVFIIKVDKFFEKILNEDKKN